MPETSESSPHPLTVAAPLLAIENLVKHYPAHRGLFPIGGVAATGSVRAVDGVSLSIARGETLGLVGESGCGKSTIARSIVGLESPSSGSIRFDGLDRVALSRRERAALGRRVQMVFQDGTSALNPRMTVEAIVVEPLLIHGIGADRSERRARATALLERVGLSRDDLAKRPHEFSGGQRQRIGIARALACAPELIIADEPVAALDVSIAAQIVNLLADLQARDGLALLFVSHDLRLVRHLCRRTAVMYLGKIVEQGPTEAVFGRPAHPYTRALLAAMTNPRTTTRPEDRAKLLLPGDPPSPVDPPSGCGFHPRCPRHAVQGDPRCRTSPTRLRPLGSEPDHATDCHLSHDAP